MMFLVFFFKQKTAYEMRISDWSSDVCSSDLRHRAVLLRERDVIDLEPVDPLGPDDLDFLHLKASTGDGLRPFLVDFRRDAGRVRAHRDQRRETDADRPVGHALERRGADRQRIDEGVEARGLNLARSEEHTSELQ